MIRLLLGLVAYLLLAGAVAVGIVDTTRWLGDQGLVPTSVEQLGGVLAPKQLDAFRAFAAGRLPAFFWDPLTVTLLRLPAALILGLGAVALFLLVRRRRRHSIGWLS